MSGAKRSRGRPAEGVRIDIRIPTELLERIDAEAADWGVSRAEQIRRIVAVRYGLADTYPPRASAAHTP